MTAANQVSFEVPLDLDGERADRALARLAGVSRAVARRALEEGTVTRDGARLRGSTPVTAGDHLSGEVPVLTDSPPPSGEVPVNTVYADDSVLVVDKPAGLVVHPGAGHLDDTLVSGLIHDYDDIARLGAEHRWGIVHRLDRDTSGLLLVARTAEVQGMLQDELRQRRVIRNYLALAIGGFDTATGTIEAPIGRDPHRPTRMAVRTGGRPARTHYQRRASWERPAVTLLDISLETGRTHQIRVHLASIGHAVVGDGAYGQGGPSLADPGRPWLHATSLQFRHPQTGEKVAVTSPLPADLRQSLERLGPADEGTIDDPSRGGPVGGSPL